jgi:hypothetical protein
MVLGLRVSISRSIFQSIDQTPGLGSPAVSLDFERGFHRTPALRSAATIAGLLGSTPAELF